MVDPAAAYILTAVEACVRLAEGRGVQTVEVSGPEIGRAMVFDGSSEQAATGTLFAFVQYCSAWGEPHHGRVSYPCRHRGSRSRYPLESSHSRSPTRKQTLPQHKIPRLPQRSAEVAEQLPLASVLTQNHL
jgi:hypothetical protein